MRYGCPQGKYIEEYPQCDRCFDDSVAAQTTVEAAREARIRTKTLEEMARRQSSKEPEQRSLKEGKKSCPTCRRNIVEPETRETSKYAKFWPDDKCYVCDTRLVSAYGNYYEL